MIDVPRTTSCRQSCFSFIDWHGARLSAAPTCPILELLTLPCSPSGLCLTHAALLCFKARCDGCDIYGFFTCTAHPLLRTTTHALHLSSAFFFYFLMTSTFHSSPTERRQLGSLSCSSFSFFLSWAVTGIRTFSSSCYSPTWTGIVSKSLFICLPPLSLLLNLTSLTVLATAHLTLLCYTHWYMCILLFSSFPPLLFNVLKSIFNMFSFPLLKPLSSVPSVPHFPFVFPSFVFPCSLHPPSHRWCVSVSHRTASVRWAAPCFCVLSTQLLCLPMRPASWKRSPYPG